MKSLKILAPIVAMGLLVGCGGGSSSDSTTITTPPPVVVADPMTERDLITIFYHTPEGMCEDATFQNDLKDTMIAEGYVIDYWLFREETNSVNCATYERINNITETGGCITYDLALSDSTFVSNDTSCVIGMDLDPLSQPVAKNIGTASKPTTKDTDIVSPIKSFMLGW